MEISFGIFRIMSFPSRFIQLRKKHGLSQQAMADAIGIHVTQIKRYEAGTSQPSLEIIKKIAVTFSITTDWIIFDEQERDPSDGLKLQFEAINQMSEEDQQAIKAILEGMILKHQAKKWLKL